MSKKKAMIEKQPNELFFFYGTLRDADTRFFGVERLGAAITINAYSIDHLSGYPAVLNESGKDAKRIVGVVFSVPADRIRFFDNIERNGKWYERSKTKVLLLPKEINGIDRDIDYNDKKSLQSAFQPIEVWVYFMMKRVDTSTMIFGEVDDDNNRRGWVEASEYTTLSLNNFAAKQHLRDDLEKKFWDEMKRRKDAIKTATRPIAAE